MDYQREKENERKKLNSKALDEEKKSKYKFKMNCRPPHQNGFHSYKKSQEEFQERKFLPGNPEQIKKRDDIVQEKIEEIQKRANFNEAQVTSIKWAQEMNRNRAQSVSYGTSRKKNNLSNDQVISAVERNCNWRVVKGQTDQTFTQIRETSPSLPATSHSQRYKKIQSTLSSYIVDGSLDQTTTRPNSGSACRSFKLNLSQFGSTVRSSSIGGGGGLSSRCNWNALTKTLPLSEFTNDMSLDQQKKTQEIDLNLNLYDPTVKLKDFVQVNRLATQSPHSSPRTFECDVSSKERGYTQNSRYTNEEIPNQFTQYSQQIQNFKNHLLEKLKTNGDRSPYLAKENIQKPSTCIQSSSRNSINLSKQSINFAVQQKYKQRIEEYEDTSNINSSYNIQYIQNTNPTNNNNSYRFDVGKSIKTSSSPTNRLSNRFVIKKRSISTMKSFD